MGFIGVLVLIPSAVILAAVGGLGWAVAAYKHRPTGAFRLALVGAGATMLIAALAIAFGGSLGGGIIPH